MATKKKAVSKKTSTKRSASASVMTRANQESPMVLTLAVLFAAVSVLYAATAVWAYM